MKKLTTILVSLFLLVLMVSGTALAAPLLDANEIGFNGQTRGQNYNELANAMMGNGKTVSTIGDKMWVPWFKTSSSANVGDLQSGGNCNSGQTIDFSHNCMVTDEFSQVGIIAAMGNDQQKMNQFYNTLFAIKSTNGDIPAWRVYRDGDNIQPCRDGINGNCDTASDATARIIIALYAAAKNSQFSDEAMKAKYLEHANKLSADFMQYEVDQTCRPSSLGYGQICNWMAGGSNVKRGGMASSDYAYTGYFADGIIAMLQAYKATGDQKYLKAAQDFGLNYLQAANWDGSTFTASPGKAFKWTIDSNGVPRAQCTNTCNPVEWDGYDASRALGMCQANFYAKEMGVSLPGMDKYCQVWGQKYMNDPNRAPLQYRPDGSAVSYQSGYMAQGLQAMFQAGGHNPGLFKPTLDSALNHYNPSTKTFDSAPAFGIYAQAFAVRALGMGIGRDLASFTGNVVAVPSTPTQPAPTQPAPQPAPTTQPAPSTTASLIGSLQKSCTFNGNACMVKSDINDGSCRTMVYGTSVGDIKVMGCDKGSNTVELYKQAAPNGMDFSACLANGCVNKDSGFARFTVSSTPSTGITTPTTSTPTTPTTTTPTTTTSTSTTTPYTGIASLSKSCTTTGGCLLKSDKNDGSCRTVLWGTSKGDVKVMACQKGSAVEVYKQAAPTGMVFSACLGRGCVSKDSGFAKFTPTSADTASSTTTTPTTSTPTSTTLTTAPSAPTTSTPMLSGIAGLSKSCTFNGNACTVKSDTNDGSCRTMVYGTTLGDIKVMGCSKGSHTYELYKQAAPGGLVFSACLGSGCVNKDSGFARFTA